MADQSVAIITGASCGIGEAVALTPKKEGFSTVLVALSQDALLEVAKEAEALGAKGDVFVLKADMSDMARDIDSPLAPAEISQPEDIGKTILWLLNLSPAATVREISIDCRSDVH